jgi:hypothetical protein
VSSANAGDRDEAKKGVEYEIPHDWPRAASEDVESPEAAVAALYAVISGPAEEVRDWNRFRSLCLPTAQFLITRWPAPEDEREGVWEWDADGFAEEAQEFYARDGFWERELWARVERFGNVAHVFSTYESRVGSPETEPIGRGINSIQLVRHEERWWIASVCWDVEVPHNRIPPEYEGAAPLDAGSRATTGEG